jgi:excisionase family DNA binding protein
MSNIAFSIRDACKASAMGRSSIYKLIKSGELRARKHGTRTLILASDLQRWLNKLPDMSPPSKKRSSPKQRSVAEVHPVAA